MIDIVIVDYDAGEPLERCLESIEQSRGAGAPVGLVCVVVNGEPSEAVSRRAAEGSVRAVYPGANIGFAAACNRGAGLGSGAYLLFLNPDTEVSAEALRVPAEYLSRAGNEHVGICGIALLSPAGERARSCSEFPMFSHTLNKACGLNLLGPARFKTGPMTWWDHRTTRSVDNVMGAFFFVRRDLFDMLGGFDERFFVYYEDLDFSLRAARAGFTSMYLHDVSAVHVGRATTDRMPGRRLYYLLISRALYAGKHFGGATAVATWLVSLLLEAPIRITVACLRGRWRDAREVLAICAPLWTAAARSALGGSRRP